MQTLLERPISRKTVDSAYIPPANFSDVLERHGFILDRHRRRAQCPDCAGSSQFTVAVYSDHAFCHRCKKRWNQRSFGITVRPDPKLIEARKRVELFVEWKETCEKILCDEIYRLGQAAEHGKRMLLGEQRGPTSSFCRDFLTDHPEVVDQAWDSLAEFYHNRATIEGALDMLTFNQLSEWLEEPMTAEKLFRAFEEALARV